MRRGRWTAPSSMRRYAKETALLAELSAIHAGVFEFGRIVEAHLSAVMEHGLAGAGVEQLVPIEVLQALRSGPIPKRANKAVTKSRQTQ